MEITKDELPYATERGIITSRKVDDYLIVVYEFEFRPGNPKPAWTAFRKDQDDCYRRVKGEDTPDRIARIGSNLFEEADLAQRELIDGRTSPHPATERIQGEIKRAEDQLKEAKRQYKAKVNELMERLGTPDQGSLFGSPTPKKEDDQLTFDGMKEPDALPEDVRKHTRTEWAAVWKAQARLKALREQAPTALRRQKRAEQELPL